MGLKIKATIVDRELYGDMPLPEYSTNGSAAIDLRACIQADVLLAPGSTILIGSGIALDMCEKSIAGLLLPRSGIGYKNGIVLANLVGLIDFDYTKEVKIAVWNRGDKEYIIKRGDRICQIMFIEVVKTKFQWVDSLEESIHGGFGSTGLG